MAEPDSVAAEPKRRARAWRFKLSVRASMLAVVALSAALGWLVHRARVQNETISAIRAVGGSYGLTSLTHVNMWSRDVTDVGFLRLSGLVTAHQR